MQKWMWMAGVGMAALLTFQASADEKVADSIAQTAMSSFYARFQTSPEKLKALIPGRYDERCIGDHEDPLDLGPLMRQGTKRGECLDISSNRSVVVLGQNESDVTIGNLRYKGRFWIATFKKNSVKKVQFEIIDFGVDHIAGIPVLMAHTQVRFLFSRPIELESQVVSGTSPLRHEQLSDLTFTYNAYGINGVPYDVAAGLLGTFSVVGKAIASVDRSVEEIVGDKSNVELYDMNFDTVSAWNHHSISANMYHYLLTNFHHAQRLGYNESYQTLFRNCTTEAFDVMDEAFPQMLASKGPWNARAVPFLASYFLMKRPMALASNIQSQINRTLFGQTSSSESEVSAVAEHLWKNEQIVHYLIFSLPLIRNIHDLVEVPSIQNLMDRHMIPDDEDAGSWRERHKKLLNNEPGFSPSELCATTGICEKPNARNPSYPHILN